jgi:hypothetical protein
VSFFEPPPAPPPAQAEPSASPEWRSPPDNQLPVSLPLLLPLAQTDEFALWARGFSVYRNGLSFALNLVRRHPLADPLTNPFLAGVHPGADGFRFGIEDAAGGKATNLDQPWRQRDGADPRPPVLCPHGGGGNLRHLTTRYWLWPLPPPGKLTFACAWQAAGIDETQTAIETEPIRAVAEEVVELWPERHSQGGWSGSYRIG